MSDYSQILESIIAEHLGDVDISTSSWSDFMQAINDAFIQYDDSLSTLERSLAKNADELVMANEEMHAVFQAIPDQLIHLNEDGQVIAYKSGLSSHHYLVSDQLINKSISEVVQKKIAETFDVAIQSVMQSRQTIHFEFMVKHEESNFYYEVRIVLVKSQQVILMIRDITERKNTEEKIAYLAYHDGLTGLPNTRLFKDRLTKGIASAKRNNHLLAVLFLDLDRFKIINDTMGHAIGDELLQATSKRLLECVRDSDSIGLNATSNFDSSVARMGGDEFTILLEGFNDAQSITRIAKRLIDKVSEPINLNGQDVYTTTSIGVAVYPEDGDEVGVLLRNADAAMYHAKDQGKNNFQFYTESMNKASAQRLELENSLRRALSNQEFKLHYQPQLDVISGNVIGMEALIRWHHTKKGFISPAVFIPLAEDTGLIVDIGEWVIQETCRQISTWIQAGYEPVKISVNLSAKQLQMPGLADFISETLTEYNVPVKYFAVELTESAIILEPEIALDRLNTIKSLGVKLSLDDFGTGYSSLSYLRRFPIDTLKIDQSFIRDIKIDQEASALVKAIISMGQSLGMDVVAEGVETEEQLEFLKANACDIIQGYLFSKPAPAEELNDFLIKSN